MTMLIMITTYDNNMITMMINKNKKNYCKDNKNNSENDNNNESSNDNDNHNCCY